MYPKAIFIQLNEFCNASCTNCPYSDIYGKKTEKKAMEDRVWYKILDDIKKADYKNQIGFYLHFEPLTEKTIFKKIHEINTQTKAFAVLSTNGALLLPDIRRKLISVSPFKVHININSADPIQYRAMTGLDFSSTIKNIKKFIQEVGKDFSIEINCPVQKEVDTEKLLELFPKTHVNTQYWANSRGGLIKDLLKDNISRLTRFNIEGYCEQPIQNFNILVDGFVITCCQDWLHESKKDFPNILDTNIFKIYNSKIIKRISKEFQNNNYSRYKMCQICSREMGWRTL